MARVLLASSSAQANQSASSTMSQMYGEVFPLSEYLTLSTLIVLSFSTFTTNLFLLIAIYSRSAKNFRYYFFVLLNVALVDTSCSLLTFFLLPSYTANKGNLLVVSFGLCGSFGEFICKASYTIMACLYSYIPWLILASLSFRCYVLRYSNPKNPWKFFSFLFICASPTICQFILSFSAFSQLDQDSKSLLQSVYPAWDFSKLTTFAIPITTDWRIIWVNYLVTYPIIPISIASCSILAYTYFSLAKITILSENSKKMQRSFLYALTLQTLLLPISLLKSFLFTLNIYLNIQNVYWGHLGFILMEFIPLANAFSHLYFIATYRHFVKTSILCMMGKRSETPVTIIQNNTTQLSSQ